MSMVINLVEDQNIYLCEGGPVYNGGVQPTPITYLTQWKIVGNSEVHTLPYPDGVVLPNGYKRCEYLQSDGVAYIEVPFGFDKTDEVYAKVAMLDITHMDKYFVSPKVWNDANNRFAMGTHKRANNNCWCCGYGSIGTSASYLEPFTASDTNEHIWQYKNYEFTLDDGSIAKKVNDHLFDSETTNLRLFYGYNTPTECKICEYRHKKANAEYRLIPCLDSNNTPCMYDVINNQAYYNSAGSGSFTYELYPQPTEIWSCGEYNATDGKWHILVQPQGGSIADIALTEPLRKVGNVTDTIEFPSDTDGKALVTRPLKQVGMANFEWRHGLTGVQDSYRYLAAASDAYAYEADEAPLTMNTGNYRNSQGNNTWRNAPTSGGRIIGMYPTFQGYPVPNFAIYDPNYNKEGDLNAFLTYLADKLIIYQLATPTTELIDAPQIQEVDSYSMVISQGGKAVSWSSFITNSE